MKHDSKRIIAYVKSLEDPYASLSIYDQPDEHANQEMVAEEQGSPLASRPGRFDSLSKTDFRLRCRQILRQYIPPTERGHLRPHHRDFITRNESRSPEQRYLIWKELNRYDLSAAGNFKPHFNREQDSLTKEKLLQIEKTVESGEHQ